MSLLPLLLVLASEPPAATDAAAPRAKVVKFDELVRAVKAHKGKVVVVDFWNDG